MRYTQCHINSFERRVNRIYLCDRPNKTRLGEVDFKYNATIGMVRSGILERGSPEEVWNN